jgi:hypothetical protein
VNFACSGNIFLRYAKWMADFYHFTALIAINVMLLTQCLYAAPLEGFAWRPIASFAGFLPSGDPAPAAVARSYARGVA